MDRTEQPEQKEQKGTLQDALDRVNGILDQAETYDHAARVLNYDLETICPEQGMERQGDVIAFLQNQAFRLRKDPAFIRSAEDLYAHREALGEFDRVLAETLHREYLRTKNITPEQQHAFDQIYNQAFLDWMTARNADGGKGDFSLFLPSLEKVREAELKRVSLREDALPDPYDNLLDEYERGITAKQVDAAFDAVKRRLLPLLRRIQASPKRIRTDFLSRPVTDQAQKEMADYLLDVIGFDRSRGAWTLTEHPFTDGLWKDDNRITTHFYPRSFTSSMYSILHEGGHALFEMLQPAENYDHHIFLNKSYAMHESVSRFYENRIGRSRPFVHLIFPRTKAIFADVLADVSEEEFYEALNVVRPSLIRTDADEFTYTFHIIIRYELEKAMVDDRIPLDDLPRRWADQYESYLGIRPACDREGILQDVHWASGFGYFFSYAFGNMYNAMYYNRMREDFAGGDGLDEIIAAGDFQTINQWMADHVFARADRLDAAAWLREITGRDFTPDDFLDYLEEKYSAIYEL